MKSMTGFGTGTAPLGRGHVVIELRSVNHRFLDVRVRATQELADAAMHLEQSARKRLSRGRFEIVLRADGVVRPQALLNTDRARAVFNSLCELRDSLSPGADVPFSMLAQVPELFDTGMNQLDEAALEAVDKAFSTALSGADEMRKKEGHALRLDLLDRLGFIELHLRTVGDRRQEILEAYRIRLRDKIGRLLADIDVPVDPLRLEQEVAITAERCDVEEELTRIQSHLSQFRQLTDTPEPVGRRLDFLLQEMAREANTIGSKSQDALVAHAVVEMRAEIERMREQVQNVE